METLTTNPTTTKTGLVVTFELDQQRYALPLAVVAQVIRLPALTPLVGAHPAVLGMLNLHGRMLPVIDGRILLGAPEHLCLESCILVLLLPSGEQFGLLVDSVERVQRFSAQSFQALETATPYLEGLFYEQEELVMLLEPGHLAEVAAGLMPAD